MSEEGFAPANALEAAEQDAQAQGRTVASMRDYECVINNK